MHDFKYQDLQECSELSQDMQKKCSEVLQDIQKYSGVSQGPCRSAVSYQRHGGVQ